MDLCPNSFPTDVEFAKLVITFASLSSFSISHEIISLFIPGEKLKIEDKKLLRNKIYLKNMNWKHKGDPSLI